MANRILKILDKYILLVIVFLFPLFFLPIFPNYFDTAKLLLLVGGILFLSLIKIALGLTSNSFRLSTSKVDIFVVLFSVIYLISGLIASSNKLSAFFVPGPATFIIFASILYFFITQLDKKDKNDLKFVLILSTFLAACVHLVSFIGLMQKNFSTFGNIINSFVYYLAVLPIAIYEIFKKDKIYKNILFGIFGIVILISAYTSFYLLLPGKNPSFKLPKLSTSWSIAIDSLKISPLIGVGPANYLESYNKLRPITTNSEDGWASRFLVSSNTPLTIFSEVGIFGLIAFWGIFYITLKKAKFENPIYISLILILLASFVLPLPASIFPLIFLLVGLIAITHESIGNFNSKIPIFIISLPIAILVFTASFFSFIAFKGEYNFFKVIGKVNSGDGKSAYENIYKTIGINQYSERYHLAAASIDMALVNLIAKKENLTDEDKGTITKLIQQAIQEGKAAISLNPRSASNWENLGDIYRGIISFAAGADNFAIDSYSQAIFLDPINPNTRIKLGGVYFGQGKFAEAVRVFELAVLAKSDLANAHYNLAMAYKENKELDKAKEQMNITLSLVGKDSKDFELAKKELETIEGLTLPQPSPEPVIEPQIKLPSEAVPPEVSQQLPNETTPQVTP